MGQTETSARDLVAEWPEEQRVLAETLIAKYGEPQEVSSHRLTWIDNRPWKRTSLHREGVAHDFPTPHVDMLEQTVDYRVPLDKVADLLRFDGSLTIRRTAGELSAECNDEGVNFLSINLADELCTGRTDVEGARRQYAESVAKLKRGESTVLTRGFTFSVMRGGTAEPDVRVL